MTMPAKSSTLLPLLFTALTVLFLCSMGVWQIKRLQWKESLIADYEAAQSLPATPLEDIPPEALTRSEYRPVTVTGTFLHEHEFHLGARRYYGNTGYHLLTPMRMRNGNIVLINRGWIPTEFKDQETRQSSLLEGEITIQGRMRNPKASGLFTPENHPEKNFWFTADIPAMQELSHLPLLPVIVEAVKPNHPRTVFPAPSDGNILFRNDHLGYALTWFSLAIAALVMYWFRFVRKPA